MLLALTGCLPGADDARDDALPTFASPQMVEVQKGDSLSKLAMRNYVSVDELKMWNGLESDVIEPGQILLVWETTEEALARPKDATDRPVRTARAKPQPSSWNPLARLVGSSSEPEPAGDADVAAVDPAAPSPRSAPILVRGAGILGIDLGGADDDLEASARNMRTHESNLDKSGIGNRGDGFADGGEAGSFQVERRLDANYGGVQIPNTPVTPPRLSKPSPKRCLKGPSEADLRGDEDMVGATGLTSAQINAGMSKVVRTSSRCFPSGTQGTYSVVAELIVGCDGVVDSVRMVSTGVVPNHVTSCITQTLGYAGFAAHAMPDGVIFQYPLKYSF